jgi:hypothetical protein
VQKYRNSLCGLRIWTNKVAGLRFVMPFDEPNSHPVRHR